MNCTIIYESLDVASAYIYCILFSLTGVVAAFSNVLVLLVLWQPQQRTKSNKIFMSLAVSDLIVGFISCPLNAAVSITVQRAGLSDSICLLDTVRRFFLVLAWGSSSISVGVIAYDRYLLLTKLNNYRLMMTNRKLYLLIFVSWFIPIFATTFKYMSTVLYWFSLVLILVLPFFILLLCYFLILHAIKKSHQQIQSHIGAKKSITGCVKSQKMNVKLAKKVTSLIITYAMCSLPCSIWMCMTLVAMSPSISINKNVSCQVYTFSTFIGLFNSALNPFIYSLRDPQFKRCLKKLFGQTVQTELFTKSD